MNPRKVLCACGAEVMWLRTVLSIDKAPTGGLDAQGNEVWRGSAVAATLPQTKCADCNSRTLLGDLHAKNEAKP